MLVYGYAKDYKYTGDGTLQVRVRIPSIHGPWSQKQYKGKTPKNYVLDEKLPYYPALLMPHLPNDGEVVLLSSTNDRSSDFVVLGITGGSYYKGLTNLT